jgi:hypothetical protein
MSNDLIIRVIVVVETLIVVVLVVLRVSWPLMVIVKMLIVVKIIKVIVNLMVVMLAISIGTSLLLFLQFSLKYSFSLDCLIYKVFMDSTLLGRLIIWVDILFISTCISCNCSWISLKTLLEFGSIVIVSSRLFTRRSLCKWIQY